MNGKFAWRPLFAWAVARAHIGLAGVFLSYLVLMIVGAVKWYTPVPFWDMWDAYLYSYIEYLEGNWTRFFAQPNEHRIIFSKVFFWLDLHFFGGRSLLLIPLNLACAIGLWVGLVAASRRLFMRREMWGVVAFSIGVPVFSWMQEPNITWGFQSQFLVAYLFPLLTFICLAMSEATRTASGSRRSLYWFIAALICGLSSLGTMANGLLAMPLMLAMIFLGARPTALRMAAVVVLGTAATGFWFYGYTFIPRPPATLSQAATFLLTFLGLPFIRVSGNLAVGYMAASFFLASSLTFAWTWLRRRQGKDPMFLALLVFIIYIGGSAALMAIGRAGLEPNASLLNRYATPSLLAWTALAILFAQTFQHRRYAREAIMGAGLTVALFLLPIQLEAAGDAGPHSAHRKMLGALALQMDVMDIQSIGQIYPADSKKAIDRILFVAQEVERHGLSIMGDPDLRAAVAAVGSPAAGFRTCESGMGALEAIAGEPRFRRVTGGWVFDAAAGRVPVAALIASDQIIEGVVVTGYPRRDVASHRGRRAVTAGFSGFVRADAEGRPLRVLCL